MFPLTLYKKLLSHYGPQLWWPVTEKKALKPTYKKRPKLSQNQKLEICLGAILTQNTDWKNVIKAFENLNKAKMLSSPKIAKTSLPKLARLIRPSGYYNQKAKKVKLFCQHLEKNYNGKLDKMLSKPLPKLREELLSLYGIGNETADDILLYAAQKPSFVVDAYTTRFVERFFTPKEFGYVEVKSFFESQLPKDTELFSEFHALLVEHGKRFCKKKPECGECFLKASCLHSNKCQ